MVVRRLSANNHGNGLFTILREREIEPQACEASSHEELTVWWGWLGAASGDGTLGHKTWLLASRDTARFGARCLTTDPTLHAPCAVPVLRVLPFFPSGFVSLEACRE